MCCELYWLLPNETPTNETAVIVENLNGIMYADFIGPNFYSWGDDIARWAYFPDKIYAKYKNTFSDATKDYKEENECLKVDLRNATEKLKNEKELNEHRIDYLEEENEKLKKDVEDWFTKYINLRLNFRNLYDKYQRDCFGDIHDLARSTRDAYIRSCIKETDREILNDICGSVNSDGDERPATDDLCEVCESDDARPVGEVSINELRDIFLKVMREAKERERVEEDDGK